ALERHAARSPARTVPDPGDLDDEVHGEERARRDELDLALEDGVLAKVLDDVPRELVLHGSVVRRLVSRPGKEALDVTGLGVGKTNHHGRGSKSGSGAAA